MLKVEINGKKGDFLVEGKGSIPELCADVTTMLCIMYDGISKENKKDFVDGIKRVAKEELFIKTNEEMSKLRKEKEKKVEEQTKELKRDLMKFIEDILK